MKILILEDDWERIEFFKKKFDGHELHITKDVEKAKKYLEKNVYDVIFLDHDLAPEHYLKDCADDLTTGYGLACYLEENVECNPDSQIIIHSMNWNGSDRMAKALRGRNVTQLPYNVKVFETRLKL